MKRLACLILLAAIPAPALAQQAAPQLDWSKPQVVDPPLPLRPGENLIIEDKPLPVEVYESVPLVMGDKWHSSCTFVREPKIDDPATADAEALYNQCVREATNKTAAPKPPVVDTETDPRLKNFSPEMREKLRPFLPPQKAGTP